jgi:sec-independent protein translocase protein TatB
MVGQWMGKARKMAAEFQGQFQEAMREAEMADLKKSFDEVKEAATGFTSGNIMTSLQKDVSSALNIGDLDKPAEAPAVPAIEPPATPTTPEAPTAETFVEAETHAATAEPLAITAEVQPAASLSEAAPTVSEAAVSEAAPAMAQEHVVQEHVAQELKDAKAS